jgi:hypothetical protein
MHRIQEILRDLRHKPKNRLQSILQATHPYILGLTTKDEVRRYSEMWEDVLIETHIKLEEAQERAANLDDPELNRIKMMIAKDFSIQLSVLADYSTFVVCHHLLGTKGFENVQIH